MKSIGLVRLRPIRIAVHLSVFWLIFPRGGDKLFLCLLWLVLPYPGHPLSRSPLFDQQAGPSSHGCWGGVYLPPSRDLLGDLFQPGDLLGGMFCCLIHFQMVQLDQNCWCPETGECSCPVPDLVMLSPVHQRQHCLLALPV